MEQDKQHGVSCEAEDQKMGLNMLRFIRVPSGCVSDRMLTESLNMAEQRALQLKDRNIILGFIVLLKVASVKGERSTQPCVASPPGQDSGHK